MIRLTISAILVVATQHLMAQSYKAKIDSLLNAYIAIGRFNGTICVVEKGSKTYEKSYGYSDVSKGELISPQSIFPLGSLTKPFTALLILKLAEAKKLSLDDPVSKFVENYPPGKEITIKHLLTHTAGIYETLRNSNYFGQLNSTYKFTNNEKIGFFKEEPLDFIPGTRFSYSNSGYVLLGIIIEKVTGLTYETCLNKYVFQPLKMKNSGFDYSVLKKEKNKVKGYGYLSRTKQSEAPLWNPYLLFSAGALYSSAEDLMKFYKGLTSFKIISKENFDKATTPFLKGYGFGWFIDTLAGYKIINHGGNIEGFTSYFLMDPTKEISIILLNNITSTSLERIGNSVYKILINKPFSLPKPKQEIQLKGETLAKYVGTYEVSANNIFTITLENGTLFLQANKEQKLKLSPEKENSFFIKDEDVEAEFISKENGAVQLKIKQGLSTKIGDRME